MKTTGFGRFLVQNEGVYTDFCVSIVCVFSATINVLEIPVDPASRHFLAGPLATSLVRSGLHT